MTREYTWPMVVSTGDGRAVIIHVPVGDALTVETERTEDGYKVTATVKMPVWKEKP